MIIQKAEIWTNHSSILCKSTRLLGYTDDIAIISRTHEDLISSFINIKDMCTECRRITSEKESHSTVEEGQEGRIRWMKRKPKEEAAPSSPCPYVFYCELGEIAGTVGQMVNIMRSVVAIRTQIGNCLLDAVFVVVQYVAPARS